MTQVLNPQSSIFPIVDRNCNYSVTFGHTTNRCVTTATIVLSDGAGTVIALGNPVMPTITLVGLPNGLQTTLETVTSFQNRAAAIASNSPPPAAVNATGFVTSISFSVDAASTTQCATTFAPVANINLPDVTPANGYQGLEFEATFTTNRQGQLAALCTSGTSTYVVDSSGDVVPKTDSNNQPMVAQLVDRTLADLSGTGRCTYTVSFTPEVGSLWLARTGGRVDPPTYPATRSDISSEVTGTTNVVAITYTTITVPIVVRSTFPEDEVFTTDDRVAYTVSINSPCGGYLGVLPRGIGNQGDSASAQVFPGTVLVYGSALRAITQGVTDQRAYSVSAYADPLGTRVCSVTVTEDSGPDRCSPVGEASQSQTYSAGDTSLAFEFTHTCEPAADASDGEEGSGGTGTPGGPPAPPAINLGEGDGTDSGTSTTTPAGPMPEGRTG